MGSKLNATFSRFISKS